MRFSVKMTDFELTAQVQIQALLFISCDLEQVIQLSEPLFLTCTLGVMMVGTHLTV